MLQNISVANFLAEKLNSEGQSKDMAFKIFADAGAYEGASAIHGVLSVVEGNGSPIEDFMSVKYVYALNFEVVDHNAGERIKIFNEILSSVIRNMQGHSYFLDGGEAIFTFGIPLTSDVKVKGGFGLSIASSLSITVAYSTTAVTTSNKVWLLDGFNVPYLDENIDLEIEGSTNNIYGLNSAQSLPIKQTRFYRFTLPFSNANPLCAVLQKDMLSGDMTKVYTLSYYDGISYTKENPFITKVSLFRTGNSGASKPSVSNFSVVFTDVDDDSKGGVRYEMALIDNPFDSGSANVRYFSDRLSQQNWYSNKIAQGAPYSTIKAPNLESLTITQQIYIKPPSCNIELNNLLTKNYAVIRATDKKTNNVLYYYYYYVQSASVGANNQIMVGLNLDTIQTYYFDPNVKIADCLIERAHLNRWIDNKDGTVSFNNAPDSPLLLRESTENVSKRIVSREKLIFKVTKNNLEVNNWFKNNVKGWVYYYFKPFKTTIAKPELESETYKCANVKTNYTVAFYPIYSNEDNGIRLRIEKVESGQYEICSESNLTTYIKEKNITSQIICVKTSVRPPWDMLADSQFSYKIENDGLKMSIGLFSRVYEGEGKLKNGICIVFENNFSYYETYPMSLLNYTNTFNKTNVTNKGKDTILNPKLYNFDYLEIVLNSPDGEKFSYDFQKLNANSFTFAYNEILSPDITVGYLRIINTENSVYGVESNQNLTGLVYSSDMALPFSSTAYDEFIVNNRNFYQIASMQKNQQYANVGMDSILKSLKSPMEAAMSLVNAGQSAYNIETDYKLKMLSIDNMRQSPDSVKNVNGNPLFLNSICDINLYLEIYQALNGEVALINDNMNLMGYSYNRIGNIKDYEHIRYYFNCIKAKIESISGISISNDARNDIRRRFAGGIRFWNSDDVQYNKENYENWLAN